jgi:glutamate--cysteine ligase
MLNINDRYVKEHLLEGNFGLEKESLRVLEDGRLSHTNHPFPDDDHIVKDFCENQTEINTSVHTSVEDAVGELDFHNQRIYKKLQSLPDTEYLWPFSNPPHIENENDIPVAIFEGEQVSKSAYREYLSDKYGRYKMTFSGIHVNYSFSDELLEADYANKPQTGFQEYKDRLYLDLAEQMAEYGWLLVAVTAASPVMDSSFVEKGVYGEDVFTGMASVRCSEMGYWNEFAPIFDYTTIKTYADSIQKYVDLGLLKAPSELYYPIRLKPAGENNLDTLRHKGVNHIELRMFDLNPLEVEGVSEKDVRFAQLLMVWLVSTPKHNFTQKDQVKAIQNFKNAARYDLKTVKIMTSDGKTLSVAQAAMDVINEMKVFYHKLEIDVEEILDFQYNKFVDASNRYAWQIREQFQDGYVKKALELAKKRQERKQCVNYSE